MALLDAWLFKIEDAMLAERNWIVREQWHDLRDLVRIFNPHEARDCITTARVLDLVYDMQGQLFGPEEEESGSEPVVE